jgi:hypothetical protein
MDQLGARARLDGLIEKLPDLPGCWLWMLSVDKHGYGQIRENGRPVRAHRFAYRAFRGPIPGELGLDHLCRTPTCVNPWHLEAVPHRVNVLRGVSLIAHYAKRTHCDKGHLFDRVVYRRSGIAQRYCSWCHEARRKSRIEQKRALGLPWRPSRSKAALAARRAGGDDRREA